ncbi:hypothetical protein BCV71DRAFT_240043, partial [Rhizopus microsporus]
MENNNNNQSTTSCSSCHASLSVDSRHRTCQAGRKRVAASRRRHRVEDQQEEAGVTTRPRGRPRRTVESVDAESRPRGKPRAEPAAYISQLSRLRSLDLGRMDKECSHCHALHWIDERQEALSLRNPSWESCCKRGSVQLQLFPKPPQYLKYLLASTDTQGRHFKDNLRQYNAAFAFTSLGYDIVSAEERNANNSRGGLNAFQIHGALCHRQGPLIPYEGSEPSYAQLYIYDPSFAAQRSSERNENLNLEIITELSTMLSHCNPFSCIYRHAHEILSRNENTNTGGDLSNNTNDNNESNNLPYIIISPSMRMRLIEGSDRCTTNLPTMEEVAAVIPTEYSDRSFRDIVLTLRSYSNLRQSTGFDQHFRRISHRHAAYMPIHHVLLFPHGAYGWHLGVH